MDQTIYLPGGVDQFNHLKANTELNGKSILIIGPNTENIGKLFLDAGANTVAIIIDDYDLLIRARLLMDRIENISAKFMEYSNTDFENATYDIVYTQGAISNPERNKVLKEARRISKPQGIINVGEYISLAEVTPEYVNDVWKSGNILPLNSIELTTYYKERKFEIVDISELSSKLKEFYLSSKKLLIEKVHLLTDQEKIYYKKLLKRINHESNVYLNLGGNDYMGFSSLLFRTRV